jgi:hypothetical protein
MQPIKARPPSPPRAAPQILDRSLLSRLALLGPVRSEAQKTASALDACMGNPTICFTYISGIQTLLSWNAVVRPQPQQHALAPHKPQRRPPHQLLSRVGGVATAC